MNYNRLKELINKKNSSIAEVCRKIGFTTQGFHYAVKNDTFKIRDLEKIAEFLNVSITQFFDEKEIQGNSATSEIEIQHLKKEIELLLGQIQAKDEIIRLMNVNASITNKVEKPKEKTSREIKIPISKKVAEKIEHEPVKS